MIDRGACWRLPERERHPLTSMRQLHIKSEYGDLVSVFTTWGNGSTATIFIPLICTEKNKNISIFKKNSGKSRRHSYNMKTWKDEGTELVLIKTDSAPLHPQEAKNLLDVLTKDASLVLSLGTLWDKNSRILTVNTSVSLIPNSNTGDCCSVLVKGICRSIFTGTSSHFRFNHVKKKRPQTGS